MASTQQQDLNIYKNNSILDDTILNSQNSYSTLVSYVEGTQPTWLVNSIIETSLVGTSILNKDLKKASNRSDVFVLSFTNPKDFYIKNLKKHGIDLKTEKQFHFIDCFSDLFTKYITSPVEKNSGVIKMFDEIFRIIGTFENTKKVIILESPEILMFSIDITSIQLSNFVMTLNRLCRNLYIISSQNFPQHVDLTSEHLLDPVYKNTDFLTRLHHRSNLNIYLEPLTTGRADDITGILTITKGPQPYKENINVNEKSYVYHLTKESNIKLYFK